MEPLNEEDLMEAVEQLPVDEARKLAQSEVLDSGSRESKSAAHLAKLKEALLLYVNAKYMTHIKFIALEQALSNLGVSKRSVDGAWSVVREVLRRLGSMNDAAAASVATRLIQNLAAVPRKEDVDSLLQSVQLQHHPPPPGELPLMPLAPR